MSASVSIIISGISIARGAVILPAKRARRSSPEGLAGNFDQGHDARCRLVVPLIGVSKTMTPPVTFPVV